MEKAYKALDDLRLLMGLEKEEKEGKSVKMGVIYSLSSKGGKVYIGFEYDRNIENIIKDLLVRYVSYMEMGYLHESSAGVLNDAPVSYKLLERVEVSSKYELARKAEVYMLEMEDVVNIWKPEELMRGVRIGLFDDDDSIEEVERYKKEKEEELKVLFIKKNDVPYLARVFKGLLLINIIRHKPETSASEDAAHISNKYHTHLTA